MDKLSRENGDPYSNIAFTGEQPDALILSVTGYLGNLPESALSKSKLFVVGKS